MYLLFLTKQNELRLYVNEFTAFGAQKIVLNMRTMGYIRYLW